jgi:DNA-binding IclR family transcriptional regulator
MQPHSSLMQGLSLVKAAVQREHSGRTGFSISRLAEHVGLERSRASRLTQELRAMRFLELDEGQALRAGPAFFSIAAVRNEHWMRSARAELRRLGSRFDVSARISSRFGAGALLLRSETGVGVSDVSVRPGMITPVWCTGAGRALLIDLDDDAVAALLSDVVFVGVGGPRAPHSVPEVLERLARDREAGCAVAVEEYEQGRSELGVPIRDGAGAVVAAISVVTTELSGSAQAKLGAELDRARSRLEAVIRNGGASADQG